MDREIHKQNHQNKVYEFFNNSNYLKNSSYRIYVRKIIIEDILKSTMFHPKSILDLGCGNGELSISLAKKNNSGLCLVDLSDYMVEQCVQNVKLSKLTDYKIINGSFDQAPNKKYDLILCIGLVAHVENTNLLFKNINRRLNKNGLLIIETTPNPYPLKFLFFPYYFFKSLIKNNTSYNYKKNRVGVNDLSSMLEQYGMDKILHSRFNVPLPGIQYLPTKLKNFYTLITYKVRLLSYFGSESILCFKKK